MKLFGVRKPALVLFIVANTAFATGCKPESKAVELSATGVIEPTPQRPGDPDKGYKALTEYAYVTCGIPYNAFVQLPETNAKTLPGRTGQNADLPYFFTIGETKANSQIVTTNCLACHATELNGDLVIGLGNETLDFTIDQSVSAERVGTVVQGEVDTHEWRKWADRIAVIGQYMRTDTVGVNPANNLTLGLIAHRDASTLTWSDAPQLEPPPRQPLPVSVPPWWRMKKKNAMFYTSEGRGDHARLMMTAALLCTDSVEEASKLDKIAPDMRAYLESIEAPQYPYSVSTSLAADGRAIFLNTCSRCHGTYGEDETYPNLVIPLEEIGSDPELAIRAVEQSDRFIDWYNESYFGELATAAPARGYTAPPLDGIWATGPFLHNGSVPDIASVINSKIRPKYWKPPLDHTDYNQSRLGWTYEEVDYNKSTAPRAESKFIYDTTLSGYSNSGHLFGDHLSRRERIALLEYIKTL